MYTKQPRHTQKMWTTNISIIFLFAQTVTSISRVKTNGYFSSSVTFDPGVGYENFLVKIDVDFEESNCAQILNDLKVYRLRENLIDFIFK